LSSDPFICVGTHLIFYLIRTVNLRAANVR